MKVKELKNKDIKEIKNTFLYRNYKNGKFCFAERLENIAFYNQSTDNAISNNSFASYMFNMFSIAALCDKKPSFIYNGNGFDINDTKELLGKDYNCTTNIKKCENSYCCFCKDKAMLELVKTEVEKNRDDLSIPLFVVIDELSNDLLNELLPLLVVSRSRNIIYIINFENNTNYENIDLLLAHFNLTNTKLDNAKCEICDKRNPDNKIIL